MSIEEHIEEHFYQILINNNSKDDKPRNSKDNSRMNELSKVLDEEKKKLGKYISQFKIDFYRGNTKEQKGIFQKIGGMFGS